MTSIELDDREALQIVTLLRLEAIEIENEGDRQEAADRLRQLADRIAAKSDFLKEN